MVDIRRRRAAVDAGPAESGEHPLSLTPPRPTTWPAELAALAAAPGLDQAAATDAGPEHLAAAEFLAQPEIGISRTQFFGAVKTWRDLVGVKKVPAPTLRQLEPSKVQEVLPAIMRGDVSPDDALADVSALGFRDLREKYRDTKSPGAGTRLAAENEPVRTRCPACHEWTTTPPVLTIREDGVIELRKVEP